MKKLYLLTAFGKDRPGIVAAVTQALFETGANVEDASMTRLGGEFAIMLVTSLSTPLPVIEKRLLGAKKKFGLEISLKPLAKAPREATEKPSTRYMVALYGTDQPGLIYRVAEMLAQRKISITDVNTKTVARGRSATYVMFLEIQIPSGFDLDDLRTELDSLRTSLHVEISLQDIDAAAL